MRRAVEMSELTQDERQCAIAIVEQLANALPLRRVEAVLCALARREALIQHTEVRQGGLAFAGALLRNERQWAVASLLALRLRLEDESSAERVIAFLGQPGVALAICAGALLARGGGSEEVATTTIH